MWYKIRIYDIYKISWIYMLLRQHTATCLDISWHTIKIYHYHSFLRLNILFYYFSTKILIWELHMKIISTSSTSKVVDREVMQIRSSANEVDAQVVSLLGSTSTGLTGQRKLEWLWKIKQYYIVINQSRENVRNAAYRSSIIHPARER